MQNCTITIGMTRKTQVCPVSAAKCRATLPFVSQNIEIGSSCQTLVLRHGSARQQSVGKRGHHGARVWLSRSLISLSCRLCEAKSLSFCFYAHLCDNIAIL
jgi:hypothetical protein